MFKESKDGIIFNLKISPNASKNELIKTQEGLKVKITAQPIDGKANKALIQFLSKEFKVPKTSIKILKGETSKDKIICMRKFDKNIIETLISFVNNEEK